MTTKNKDGSEQAAPRGRGGDGRQAKLAEQLRANLQRRKAQARSRRAGEADRRPEGLAGTGVDDVSDGDPDGGDPGGDGEG